MRDAEVIGHLNGVAAIMDKLDFLFGTLLGEFILKHTDNLSKSLQ